jgi:hypothetical protein
MQLDAVMIPEECPCGRYADRAARTFSAGNALAARLRHLRYKLEGQHPQRASTSEQAECWVLDIAELILKKTVHSMIRNVYINIANDRGVPKNILSAAMNAVHLHEVAVNDSQAKLDEKQHFAPASHSQRFLKTVAHRTMWAIEGKVRELQHQEQRPLLMRASDPTAIVHVHVEASKQAAVEKVYEISGKEDFERNVRALEELLQGAARLLPNVEYECAVHATKELHHIKPQITNREVAQEPGTLVTS